MSSSDEVQTFLLSASVVVGFAIGMMMCIGLVDCRNDIALEECVEICMPAGRLDASRDFCVCAGPEALVVKERK